MPQADDLPCSWKLPPTGGGQARSLYATPPSPPPAPRLLKDSGAGAMAPNFFVPCLVEGGTMPLVLKTPKTFFLAKLRNRY